MYCLVHRVLIYSKDAGSYSAKEESSEATSRETYVELALDWIVPLKRGMAHTPFHGKKSAALVNNTLSRDFIRLI